MLPTTAESDVDKIDLHEVKRYSKVLYILQTALQLRKLKRKVRLDLLHAHYAGINGLIGAMSGFHPFVVTVWGSDVLLSGKSKFKGPIVRYVLRKADLITCDADHMKHALVSLGVEAEKIRLIYFGVDLEKFHPKPKDEHLRQRLGVGESPTIISLRGLEPVYDIETLLRAVPRVVREIPEAMFVIAGEGSLDAKLKTLAQSLKISGNIRFVGQVSNDEIPTYLCSSDIYVSTSLSDAGLSASTAEAMACGLPVVVTDFGDNRKWVKDTVNGFIIPVKDPDVLASRIIYLLRHRAERRKFGKRNRQIISEKNNWEREMGEMERLYLQLTEVSEGGSEEWN
jgi:glycosyltransferase involved in cell wall biosynthesis